MQFQVPQNIDLEDKIIGPLTLKQFIILVVGGMIDYIWYTLFDASLFILFFLPTTLLTLALVFAKVQDQPFPKFLGSLALFVLKPKILTWGKTPPLKIVEFQKKAKEQIVHPKQSTESQIQKLAVIIDTQGWGAEERPENAKQISKQTKEAEPKASQPQPKKINPQISAPQNFNRFGGQPTQTTKIAPRVVKQAARQVAAQSKMPQEKVMSAANQIITQLKQKPIQEVQKTEGKKPLFKKILEKVGSGFVELGRPKKEPEINPETAQLQSPKDIENQLGLQGRVKTHESVKPKINTGAASENVVDDIPLDGIGP